MLLVVAALQVLLVLLVLVLVLRKQAAPMPVDARLLSLPDSMVALVARLDATESGLRNHMGDLRREQGEFATQARHSAEAANRALREEINGSIAALARTLHEGLGGFRTDNAGSAEALRKAVNTELLAIGDRLARFAGDAGKQAAAAQELLHNRLAELGQKNTASHDALREGVHQRLATLGGEQREHQERLRTSMENQLGKLNTDNAAKLEQMRLTVDEKLQSTLNERLTQSFGTVSDQLTRVHTGLGEMKELASGVSDLKKVFSNVKSRGIVGEFQLGMQLEQMFSRDQYEENIAIKKGSTERVEFALKIPQVDGEVLLPIDAKFPREDWERLEHAYEHGSKEEQDKMGAAFERAIRTEGKRICEKYIDPPNTLPFGIMFLPTEALYAEVMRRPALHTELQSSCNVTIAGPSSFMAILTSFQMGFRTLAIQKKGNEVWKVLGSIKAEFGKFEDLMNKVEGNVQTVQNTLGKIGVRTRAINRNLRGVSEMSLSSDSNLLSFEDGSGFAPLLAAAEEKEEVAD